MSESDFYDDAGDWALLLGDCRERALELPDGAADFVLMDPPFGTIKGCSNIEAWEGGARVDWDDAIPPEELLALVARILRRNGRAVLFCQEPYTTALLTADVPGIPFTSRAIWRKNSPGICLGAKKNLVSYFEDMAIFQRVHPKHDKGRGDPSRDYFRQVVEWIGKTPSEIMKPFGHRRHDHTLRHASEQFLLCGRDLYRELVLAYCLEDMPGFREWEDLAEQSNAYRAELVRTMNEEFPSVFNLPEGAKSKGNVFDYPKESGKSYHPTQKPVALLVDLLETYTRPGDLVVDLTMGSGSTGVACLRTGRRFVGVERDPGFHASALERMQAGVQR